MLIAKPAPEAKIRALASELAQKSPGISVDGFLLPRDANCNARWNTVSTRNFALMLTWYLHQQGLAAADGVAQEAALMQLLDGIVDSQSHLVLMEGHHIPVSLAYLRRTNGGRLRLVQSDDRQFVALLIIDLPVQVRHPSAPASVRQVVGL